MITRTIRLSHTISPFGVGAIYDILGESFVASDTGRWHGRGDRLHLQRLADVLGVTHFKSAPSKATIFGRAPGGVPFHRFPQWLFCMRCRRMTRWSTRLESQSQGDPPRCAVNRRHPRLVPMRFVLVCASGHLSDVPWDRWSHSRPATHSQRQCADRRLKFTSRRGAGGGLGSLMVTCESCQAMRSLEGIAMPESMRQIGYRCEGRQPWERADAGIDCDRAPQVVQRGASNVYFAQVESALDIPPQSDWSADADLVVNVTNHPLFPVLVSAPAGPAAKFVIKTIATSCGSSEERIVAIAEAEIRNREGSQPRRPADTDLDDEEWLAFLQDRTEQDERDRFQTRIASIRSSDAGREMEAVENELQLSVDRVVLATRLREVRALASFTRLQPAGVDVAVVRPHLMRTDIDWLPAIEVYGEGIFIALNEKRVREWEASTGVPATVSLLRRRYDNAGATWLREPSARFVLLHSLAHALVRQLAFECGYSSSSLRERIYCRDTPEHPMAGLLIYTAAGDVEGSLGGLVRQGEPPRLARTLVDSLQSASWCSSDPICRETPSGFHGLNQAACHACLLVSETSCIGNNALLDRRFLVGGEGLRGFFEGALATALEAMRSPRETAGLSGSLEGAGPHQRTPSLGQLSGLRTPRNGQDRHGDLSRIAAEQEECGRQPC